MVKCSSQYIYIYTLMASLSMGKADATDNITGLQIGFGLNVSRDNYESDVSVGVIANRPDYSNIKTFGHITFQSARDISNDQFTTENVTQFINDLINTKEIYEYPEKDVKFGDTPIVETYKEEFQPLSNVTATATFYYSINQCYVTGYTVPDKKEKVYTDVNDIKMYTDGEKDQEISISEGVYIDTSNKTESNFSLLTKLEGSLPPARLQNRA